jgi:hypothetical protein
VLLVLGETDEEVRESENRAVVHRSRPKPLYPTMW